MKILSITDRTSEVVETEDTIYIRYGHDNWCYIIGESEETEYQCLELESAYQVFIKKPTQSCDN